MDEADVLWSVVRVGFVRHSKRNEGSWKEEGSG